MSSRQDICNMAAMRKTLEEMAAELEDLASREGIRAPAYSSIFSFYAEKCRDAIAEPPRNCDVGTAEEQLDRYHAFSPHCKLLGCQRCLSIFHWMQMPYEK